MAEWWERARCRGYDPELFFPPPGGDRADGALAVCNRCPVKEPCLREALTSGPGYEVYGIWGGLNQQQRRGLKVTADGRIVPADGGRTCKRCGGAVPATAARAQRLCDTCRGAPGLRGVRPAVPAGQPGAGDLLAPVRRAADPEAYAGAQAQPAAAVGDARGPGEGARGAPRARMAAAGAAARRPGPRAGHPGGEVGVMGRDELLAALLEERFGRLEDLERERAAVPLERAHRRALRDERRAA